MTFIVIANGSRFLQIGAAFLLQIGETFITNQCRIITNRDRFYKSGQLLQINPQSSQSFTGIWHMANITSGGFGKTLEFK